MPFDIFLVNGQYRLTKRKERLFCLLSSFLDFDVTLIEYSQTQQSFIQIKADRFVMSHYRGSVYLNVRGEILRSLWDIRRQKRSAG